uniref:Uncharacterized protein n=1 Tax=Romanomermis culicivorax TaxID=13658 RepID=A0A915KXW9_ROMCU
MLESWGGAGGPKLIETGELLFSLFPFFRFTCCSKNEPNGVGSFGVQPRTPSKALVVAVAVRSQNFPSPLNPISPSKNFVLYSCRRFSLSALNSCINFDDDGLTTPAAAVAGEIFFAAAVEILPPGAGLSGDNRPAAIASEIGFSICSTGINLSTKFEGRATAPLMVSAGVFNVGDGSDVEYSTRAAKSEFALVFV